MKHGNSILTYLSALIVGILLLLFCKEETLSDGIVIAIGILFVIPSVMLLINSFIRKKDTDGNPLPRPWYMIAIGFAGLIFGLWMLIMPGFFINVAVYTLGLVLILCGCASLIYVINASRPFGAYPGWYVMPALTICAGLVVCFIGPRETLSFAAIFSGCFLICYSVAGFASIGREQKTKTLS